MYGYIYGIYVAISDCIQLCSWRIFWDRCIWRLGGNGYRLGVPGVVFCNPVLQRGMEEAVAGAVKRERCFIGLCEYESYREVSEGKKKAGFEI